MIIFDNPPELILPNHYKDARPAIIRSGINPDTYFPVEWDRKTRRAFVSELVKSGRIDRNDAEKIAVAIPFGMFKPAAGGGGGPSGLAFQSVSSDTTSLTTYSFTSIGIGTAAADRYVIVGVTGATAGGSPTISSVSIDGTNGTIGVQASNGFSAVAGIVARLVTAGTSITISVTYSLSMNRCSIGVWTFYGLTDATPQNTQSSQSDPATATLTATVGMPAFVIYYQRSNPAGVTWGSPFNTPDYDALYASSRYHGGAGIIAASTSLSVSVNPSTNDTHQMVAASYD